MRFLFDVLFLHRNTHAAANPISDSSVSSGTLSCEDTNGIHTLNIRNKRSGK